jgi:hypothetical protein
VERVWTELLSVELEGAMDDRDRGRTVCDTRVDRRLAIPSSRVSFRCWSCLIVESIDASRDD